VNIYECGECGRKMRKQSQNESKLIEILQDAWKDKTYFKGLNKQLGNLNKTKMYKFSNKQTKMDKDQPKKKIMMQQKRINFTFYFIRLTNTRKEN